MSPSRREPVLNHADLIGPARSALAVEQVAITGWHVQPLGVALTNPTTGGVFRVSVEASVPGGRRSWSVILKVIRAPEALEGSNMGGDEQPDHWNYWRREGLLYRSNLLDSLLEGLIAPRCFGVVARGPAEKWLWLEDIATHRRTVWPFAWYEEAATSFGRWNGSGASPGALPQAPWLSTNLVRQWSVGIPQVTQPFFDRPLAAIWDAPLVAAVIPKGRREVLVQLMDAREDVLDALARLPLTCCHNDAAPVKNLLMRDVPGAPRELVVIDWALAGIGPLGSDLGQILAESIRLFPSDDAQAIDARLFGAYLRGLRQAGWCGSTESVRFGVIATFAIRWGLYTLYTLYNHVTQSQCLASPTPEAHQQQFASYLLDAAEETLSLLPGFAVLKGRAQ